MHASEASECLSLNSMNASEVSNKQERSSRELYFPEVAYDSKVYEGLGIDTF